MASARDAVPFTAFNFSVEIAVPGVAERVCNAAFAECDGIEMTLEVKTLRQGGDNAKLIRLAGPAAYGTLTLRRGMTASFDLWNWFASVAAAPHEALRADARVVLLAEDGVTPRALFVLKNCLPVKLKAPALHAKDGQVAIEELQLVYEWLEHQDPGSGPGA